MSKKILITEAVDPAGITLLQDHGYQVVMGTGYDEETLMREAHDADGVLTRNGHFTERVLNSCPKLQVIGMHGAGVDCIDVEAAERLGIQVTNAADANSGSVAEFTLGLILSLAKKLPQSRDGLRKEGWSIRPQITTFDLEGKTRGTWNGTDRHCSCQKSFLWLWNESVRIPQKPSRRYLRGLWHSYK